MSSRNSNILAVMINGTNVDPVDASISIFDAGFTMGVSIVERIRTYAGSLPLLDLHFDRLLVGLNAIGISSISRELLTQQLDRFIESISAEHLQKHDMSIAIVISPGCPWAQNPTVIITAEPIDFLKWKSAYKEGIRLRTVAVREVAESSVAKTIKHRSRMHYFLAKREAEQIEPGSHALLLDEQDGVAESPTGSILAFIDGQWVAPSAEKVLSSVTLRALDESGQLTPPLLRRSISLDELKRAQQAYWLNATVGIAPIVGIDGSPVQTTSDLNGYQQLLDVWKEIVGLDVRSQALASL
ncbi:MAG: aminotransferase class IV [Planctomycetota bacterium]